MKLELIPLRLPDAIVPGDDLAGRLLEAAAGAGLELASSDVLVVCQKIVSKAEGRIVKLAEVRPGPQAAQFAREHGKDARLVQLALDQAREVLRMERGHLITSTGPGWISANAGIDRSNQNREDEVTLLPFDADASARRLQACIEQRGGSRPAVIISDSFGRPWRLGQVDVAIGLAGLAPLDDLAGQKDWRGRELEHSAPATADQ